jgi:hypothetical protein
LPTGERRHRNAGRHLHDREQRVHAVEQRRRHGHAQHRHERLGREHPRQVRRPARAGDDGAQPAPSACSAYW